MRGCRCSFGPPRISCIGMSLGSAFWTDVPGSYFTCCRASGSGSSWTHSSSSAGFAGRTGQRRGVRMAATYVLGINAYHGDVAAVLLRDGQLVAAVEEERFRRVKHWAGFPTMAIQTVLVMAGIRGSAVQHVAISRDPKANLLRKGLFTVTHRPD